MNNQLKKRFKRRIRKIKRYILKHPLVAAAAAGILLAVIILVSVFSCTGSRQAGYKKSSGLVLEDSYWKENADGFKYYDQEGYVSTFGIDISEWSEDIDLKAVKQDGAEFVILRVGYRGYETGKFVLDNNLDKYLKNASDAGLMIGAYFVSQAINKAEAVEEAEFVMEHLKGYEIEMPVYIDLEKVYDEARTDNLTFQDRTDIAVAFCEELEKNGYHAGVYANEVWFTQSMDFDRICQYDIWLAKYSDAPSTELPINMWQFTEEGYISGTDLWVDLDVRVTKEVS